MRRAYNVLENGKIVLANASAAEVRELLDDQEINVWKYACNGHKTQGRYTIQDTGKKAEKKIETEKTRKKRTTNTVPEEMWEEWTKVCGMFKGIAWQKRS